MEKVKLTISRELYQILYDSGVLIKGNHTVTDIETPLNLERPYTLQTINYLKLRKDSGKMYKKLKELEYTLKQTTK